jgi:hypothetical protein
MNFQEKYLKYKNKYIKLRKQIGGLPPQYFHNRYHESNPNKPTIYGINDTQALINGEFLLGKLSEYLSFTKESDIQQVEAYKWFKIFFPT